MEIITENRHRLLESLKDIETRKIISFGMPDIEHLKDKPLLVIVNKTQFENYRKPISPKWIIRTNNKIHAKIAIGLKGFVLGSWNFTENSTYAMHEAVMLVPYQENPDLQKYLADYFDLVWNRSTDIVRGAN